MKKITKNMGRKVAFREGTPMKIRKFLGGPRCCPTTARVPASGGCHFFFRKCREFEINVFEIPLQGNQRFGNSTSFTLRKRLSRKRLSRKCTLAEAPFAKLHSRRSAFRESALSQKNQSLPAHRRGLVVPPGSLQAAREAGP